MYAVIQTGGKQYQVTPGQTLKLEKLAVDIGNDINFDQVLMVVNDDGCQIGSPIVKGAQVTAQVVDQGRAKKIRIIKFRRRKHSMKQMGHRQSYTQVIIKDISIAGKSSKQEKSKEV